MTDPFTKAVEKLHDRLLAMSPEEVEKLHDRLLGTPEEASELEELLEENSDEGFILGTLLIEEE